LADFVAEIGDHDSEAAERGVFEVLVADAPCSMFQFTLPAMQVGP
jgi:hypothetical protein